MQSYAIVLACPLAILNQHFFSETRISFKNYKVIIPIYFFAELFLLLMLNCFFRYNMAVIVEYVFSCLIGLIVGGFIARFETKKDLDSYEKSEDLIYILQTIVGIAVWFYAFSDHYVLHFLSQFNKNEIILSKIIYIRLGLSYVLYNRKIFCFVHKLRKNKM